MLERSSACQLMITESGVPQIGNKDDNSRSNILSDIKG